MKRRDVLLEGWIFLSLSVSYADLEVFMPLSAATFSHVTKANLEKDTLTRASHYPV